MNQKQRDVQWLGNEEAHLGPAARAALGILLESKDWSWWDDPYKTQIALERAVPRHGLATWGGDSSLLDADQWIDPLRAIMLGLAFRALNERETLKIKVARSVWGWPSGANSVGAAIAELSQLLGPGYVFPEWKRNAKPRFPISSRSQKEQRMVTSPSLAPEKLLGRAQSHLEWVADTEVADIVVAESIDRLSTNTGARLVILYSEDLGTAFAQVSSLRDDLCAQCAVHVETDENHIANWFQLMISTWAIPGQSFADAIKTAATRSGFRTQILSATQTFLLSKNSFFQRASEGGRWIANSGFLSTTEDSRPVHVINVSAPTSGPSSQDGSNDNDSSTLAQRTFSSESAMGGGGNFSPFRESVEPTIRPELSPIPQVERSIVVRPAPPVERILNARTRQGQQEVKEWPTAGVVHIDVAIRMKTPLRDSSPSFPDDRIEWNEESKILQVHLFELGRVPERQELTLPRTGDSSAATFTRDAGSDPVDLRFIVSNGAQILQTSRLQAASGKPIRFSIENIVTPVHRAKAPFDVALLVNDSLGNQPSVTVITDNGRAVLSPLSEHETETARNAILSVLQEAVANPTATLDSLMLRLANRGALLLKSLRSIVPDWPGCINRIQLVTQSDAFFPIEYLYEGTVPESTAAMLCLERAGCLKAGQAIAGCDIREAGEVLCPMGFLGVSGVVERHTWQAGKDAWMWGAPGGSKPKRHRIEDLSTIAFGASENADRFLDADVAPHEVVRIANIETSLGVKRVSDWPDWKATLSKHSPSLLLLLVHLQNDAVYLGADAGLNLSALNQRHVGKAEVVVAMGCSSGLGEIPGSSLPAVLQRSGARVVVAAMTSVLGRHANRVARDLAKSLYEAAKSPSSLNVGEIICNLRRQLLAEGLALGLAVVAFGDADVVLGKG